MEIIVTQEPSCRATCGGCERYFATDGAMDRCIAARIPVVKDGMMYGQARAGVVADSDSVVEHGETRAKARALFRAAKEAERFAAGKGG